MIGTANGPACHTAGREKACSAVGAGRHAIQRAEKKLENEKEAVSRKWRAERILKMKKEAVRLDANLLRIGAVVHQLILISRK